MSGGSVKVRKEAWSGSDTLLAKAVARPIVRFMSQETASGVSLLIATLLAIFFANSIWRDSYFDFLNTKIGLSIGSHKLLYLSVEHFINDGLMAIFFFVVGMEIKSEIVDGDLRNPRVAALPVLAALGGVLAPATIYILINYGSQAQHGWGIPMATDIAFALGVLALIGKRVPQELKLFLLTLAIVDDIAGIIVIAIFYSKGIQLDWLAFAMSLIVVLVLLKILRVWFIPIYVIIGIVIWYATLQSGVHATIAGVILGLLTPARPLLKKRTFESLQDIFSGEVADPVEIRDTNWRVRESVAVTNRLTYLLSPWTSFLIIPLFAFANAGVEFSTGSFTAAGSSLAAIGIFFGLVVGKPLGVFLMTYISVKANITQLPKGINFLHILGVGAVSGIGFTLSLFIAKLALDSEELLNEAIIGILIASVVSALVGWFILSVLNSGSDESVS